MSNNGGGTGGARGGNGGGAFDSAGRAIALAVSATLSGMLGQSTADAKNIRVEKVSRGTARFDTRGPNTRITVSDRAIIDYRKFNVGRDQSVRFIQPSAKSRVLNRIRGAEPSQIDGRLTANGIVYLVNPAGVMFGRDAVINVGALYAAAANITDDDFVRGVNRFFGGSGQVVNAGTIEAGVVALVGRRVANQGTILSETSVTMVAGDDVLVGERDGNLFVKVDSVKGLANAGADNAATAGGGPVLRMGSGDVFSMAVHNTGTVRAKEITAQAGAGGAAVVSGTLDASGARGGSIKVLGEQVKVDGATIDASGRAGGGTVLIGGDFQGKGSVPTASQTVVTAGSTIKADATERGDGGKVIVWADGSTRFAGDISARGGARGGDGGNVEVSGKKTLTFAGHVDTTAAKGKTGSLLLDPDDIVIVPDTVGGDDGALGPADGLVDLGDLPAVEGGPFSISVGALQTVGATTNVKLLAEKSIKAKDLGEINFKQDSDHSVTLATNAGPIDLGGTTLITGGGSLELTATGGDLSLGGVKTRGGNVTGVGTAVTLNDVVDAGGGKVSLTTKVGDFTMAPAASIVTTNIGADAVTIKVGGAGKAALLGPIAADATGTIVVTTAGGNIAGAGAALTAGRVELSTAGTTGNVGDASTPVLITATGLSIDAANFNVKNAGVLNDLRVTTATRSQAELDGGAAPGFHLLDSTGLAFTATDSPGKLALGVTGLAGNLAFSLQSGDLHVAEVAVGPKNVTLAAVEGKVVGDPPATPGAPNVTAQSLDVSAKMGIDLGLAVTSVTAKNTVTGEVRLVQATDLTLAGVDASGSEVDVAVTTGDLTIGGDVIGKNVTLSAGHDILNGTTGGTVSAVAGTPAGLDGTVTLSSGTASPAGKIGTGTDPIKTAASRLVLTAADGTGDASSEINVREADSVTLDSARSAAKVSVTAASGNLTVHTVTGGAIELVATAGSVFATGNDHLIKAGDAEAITVTADKSVGDREGLLNIDAGGGVVTLTGESVHFKAEDAAGALALTPPGVAGADVRFTRADDGQVYDVHVDDSLTLEAKGAITNDAGQMITAKVSVDLRSQDAGVGSHEKPIFTAVGTPAAGVTPAVAGNIAGRAHGTGGVFITDDNGANVVNVLDTTAAGAIEIASKDGSLNLKGTIKAGATGGAAILLTAGRDITAESGHLVDGGALTLTAGTAPAATAGSVGTSTPIETNALTIVAKGKGAGSINLHDGSGGGIDVTATTGSGPVTVGATGDLDVAASTGGAVSLASGGHVHGSATGGSVTASAGADVDLVTMTDTLTATAGTGAVLPDRSVRGIRIANTAGPTSTVMLVAGRGDIGFSQGPASALTLNGARTGDGNVTVNNAGEKITLAGDVRAGGADHTADLSAGKQIEWTAGLVTATHVKLTAGTAVAPTDPDPLAFGIGAVGKQVKTAAEDLTLTATGAGDIFVSESDEATLKSATTGERGSGNIVIAAGGDLKVVSVKTDETERAIDGLGRVALSARGAITDGNGAALNIVSRELSLKAAVGIGVSGGQVDALETATDHVAAKADAGGIYLDNSLDSRTKTTTTTVRDVDGTDGTKVSGLNSNDAAIEVNQKGNLEIDAAVSAGASSVLIQLNQAAAVLTNSSTITGTGLGATPPVSPIGAPLTPPVTTPPPAPTAPSQGVTLVADRMVLDGGATAAVDAGNQVLTVRSYSDAVGISFGAEDAGALSLNQAELNTLQSSDHVEIGHRYLVETDPGTWVSKGAGDVVFANTAALSLGGADTLSIVTAGTMNGKGNPNAVISETNLSLTATKGIGTATGATPLIVDVANLAATASTPLPVGTLPTVARIPDADISIRNRRSGPDKGVTIGEVAGVVGLTGHKLTLVNDGTITVERPVVGSASVSLTALTLNVDSKARGVIKARTDVQINADAGHIDLGASVTAERGGISARAGSDAVAADAQYIRTAAAAPLQAGTEVSLNANGGIKTDGTITAGRDVKGDALGTITVGAAVTAGADLTATSGLPAPTMGNIDLTAKGVQTLAGDPLLAPGDAIVTGPTATLDARGHVALAATKGNIHTRADVTAGQREGDVPATDSSITLSAGTAPGDASVTTDGMLHANESVSLKATGHVTVNQSVTADTKSIEIVADKGNVLTSVDAPLEAEESIDLAAHGTVIGEGNISTNAPVAAHDLSLGNIVANADANINVNTPWMAGSNIRARAGANIHSSEDGTMLAHLGHVDLTAHSNVLLWAGVDAGNASRQAPSPTSGHIRVVAETGEIQTFAGAMLDAKGFVSLDASHGNVTTGDAVFAGQHPWDVSDFPTDPGSGGPGGPPSPSAYISMNAGGTIPAGGTLPSPGSVTTSGELRALGYIDLKAQTDVTIDGKATAQTDYIHATATARDVTNNAPLSAETNVHLDAGANVKVNETVTAKTEDITAVAHDVSILSDVNGDLLAATFVKLEAGLNIDLQGTATAGTQSITGVAGQKNGIDGSITTADALTAGSFISLAAPVDITLSGPATSGTVTTGTPPAGHVLAVAGHDIVTNGEVDARTYVKFDAGHDITAQDNPITAGTHVSFLARTGDVTTLDGAAIEAKGAADPTDFDPTDFDPTDLVQLPTGTVKLNALEGNIESSDTVTAKQQIVADAKQDVIVNRPWVAQDRDILVRAGNDIHTMVPSGAANPPAAQTGSLSAGRHVELTAGRDVTLDAGSTAATNLNTGHFVATAGRDFTTNGGIDVSRGQDVTVTAGQNILATAKPVVAGSDLTFTAGFGIAFPTGDITTKSGATLTALGANSSTLGGDVTLDASKGTISLGDDVLAKSDLTAKAKGDITTLPGAPIEATDGTVKLTSVDRSITTHDTVTAAIDIVANAKNFTTDVGVGNVSTDAPWSAGNDILVTAGRDVTTTISGTSVGSLKAGRHVELEALNHDVSLQAPVRADGHVLATAHNDIVTSDRGTLSAGASITLDAGHSVTLAGSGTADSDFIEIYARSGDITTAATAPLKANTYVLLDASASGNILTRGTATSTREDIRATAAASITAFAPWSAGNDVLAKAGVDIVTSVSGTSAGSLSAGRHIELDAGHDVNLGAFATAGTRLPIGHIVVTADHDALTTEQGILTARASVTIEAGNDIKLLGSATATDQFVQAHALGGSISTGAKAPVTAGTYVDLQAKKGTIGLGAAVTARGDYVQALASGDITSTPQAPVRAGSYVLFESSVGSILTDGTVTADRLDIRATAAASIVARAPWSAGQDILAKAGADIVTLVSGTSAGSLTAARQLELDAGRDITLAATATAGTANAELTAGGNILTQDLVKAGADLLATAGGDITVTGDWSSGRDTTAKAGHDINVQSTIAYGASGLFDAKNDVAFNGAGGLVKGNGRGDTQLNAGRDITMAAGSLIDGGSAQVSGTAGGNVQLARVTTRFARTDEPAVALVAGGSITDLHSRTGDAVVGGTQSVVATGGGLRANAGTSIDLGTQVDWVEASAAAGPLTLNEVDALHVRDVQGSGGDVTITTATDGMLVRNVFADGTNAILRAFRNDIRFEDNGAVKATRQATLIAAGSIIGRTRDKNVQADVLDATAGAQITLGTEVRTITSFSGGDTTLHDHRGAGVTLESVLTAAGDIDVTSDATMTVNLVRAGSNGGNDAKLTALGRGSILGTTDAPNVRADELSLTAAGGSIDLKTEIATLDSLSGENTTLHDASGLTLRTVVSTGGNIKVASDGPMTVQSVKGPTGGGKTIDLAAAGDITGTAGGVNVTGDHLVTTATAGGAILLNTEINSLTSTSEGDATFHEQTGVAIDLVSAPGRTVTLTAGQSISDGNRRARNVDARTLVIDAQGVDLDTHVDELFVTARPGDYVEGRQDVQISEDDDVTIRQLSFESAGNLNLASGGNMTLAVNGVDTRGGDQRYAGALILAAPDTRNFTLTGNDILLRATVDSASPRRPYALTVNATGNATFLRAVGGRTPLAGLATDRGGTTTIKTQVHTRGGMEFYDRTTLAGAGATLESDLAAHASTAVLFSDQVVLGGSGAKLVTHGGGVQFRQAVVDSSGDTTISTNTGDVEFLKGITGTLTLTIDATDGRPVANKSPDYGDVTIGGAASLQDLTLHGGNVTVHEITATPGAGGRGGNITLAADPRIVAVPSVAAPGTLVLGPPPSYATPRGVLTLNGNLTADAGGITLGDVNVDRASLGLPVVPFGAGALGNPIPAVATIVAFDGDLDPAVNLFTIKITANDVTMGKWDKMTVFGSVDITAHGRALLSDIAAVERIDVKSPKIDVQFRDPSALLNDTGVLGTEKLDFGVDFFANAAISFSTQPDGSRSRALGQSVEFGVGPQGSAAVPGFGFRRRREAAKVTEFQFADASGGRVVFVPLDATAEGPSSTDISVTLTQALPQESPKPTEDSNLNSSRLQQLVDMGIYARKASDQELIDRASGRVVYLDVLPSDRPGMPANESFYTVVAGKLPDDVTRKLIELDRDVPVNPKADAEIRKLLTQAYEDHRKANEGKAFDPVAFRAFLDEGDYKPVIERFAFLEKLLLQVKIMSLTEQQAANYQRRLMESIKVDGLSVSDLARVIQAKTTMARVSLATPPAR